MSTRTRTQKSRIELEQAQESGAAELGLAPRFAGVERSEPVGRAEVCLARTLRSEV